jgi:hypothetical protein
MIARTRKLFATVLLAAAAAAGGATLALAGDPVGDASVTYLKKKHFKHFDCDSLWYLRNQIFDEAGYCFKTERAIYAFGNDGCTSGSYAILNKYERAHVSMIKSIEAAKGCNL